MLSKTVMLICRAFLAYFVSYGTAQHDRGTCTLTPQASEPDKRRSATMRRHMCMPNCGSALSAVFRCRRLPDLWVKASDAQSRRHPMANSPLQTSRDTSAHATEARLAKAASFVERSSCALGLIHSYRGAIAFTDPDQEPAPAGLNQKLCNTRIPPELCGLCAYTSLAWDSNTTR